MLVWTKVTTEHVRQACALFDAGDVRPRRPAKSTFLLLDGKSYPGKFIRGLAHKLATGIEPGADEYAGGTETARFFERLGFATSVEAVAYEAPAQGTVDSTLEDVVARLDETPSTKKPRSAAPRKKTSSEAGGIKRIGLVSHDYNIADSRGYYDYSEHFAEINRICDEQGCDTVLYSLFTWDATSPTPRTHESIFDGLRNVRRIILEVGDPPEENDHVEVWDRAFPQPTLVKQKFATSSASVAAKQKFIDELEGRRIEDAILMICGETNIASLVRGSDDFYDPWGFLKMLDAGPAQVILNPIHDFMRRYEMRKKRGRYSKNGRTVVSVWNQGKGSEAWLPWTVFHDGEERTDEVREIETPIPSRADVRIGIAEV